MDCFASLAMTAAHCGWLCHCPVRPACSIFMASDTDQPTIRQLLKTLADVTALIKALTGLNSAI
jgi:hypothetical protein